MALDERGRLYVSDSSGSNDPVEKQLADRPHRVLRLEDTDGDGRFDRRTVFADHLMFPEGTMWFGGSLYVSAPPSIWKLTDADDDGVAERREEWFAGKTLTGCANDLHGPYLGRDGWIYWCKGAFAEQTYDLPNRPGWKTRASHIFRARPDGSGLEPVLTGGMDNPVDVVFTAEGERILSCTFLVQPGGGKRDGLIHAIYGGVYGKQHDVLDGHTRTGELMPPLAHLGPAAACGLHYCESPAAGDDFRGNLLACQFNLHKVTRHKLLPAGSSYRTEESDFVTSESTDFHPTDVLEDADGSVLVCDTGGWYKLCCPTSQFHKPNVLGAIYRVRRAGAAPIDDPRGEPIDWNRRCAGIWPNCWAIAGPWCASGRSKTLAARGKESIGPLAEVFEQATRPSKRNSTRFGHWRESMIADARLGKRIGAGRLESRRSATPPPMQPACGETRRGARPAVPVPGRFDRRPWPGQPPKHLVDWATRQAVGPLLSASRRADDRALEHSIIYALIEIGDAKAIRRGLTGRESADAPRGADRTVAALGRRSGGRGRVAAAFGRRGAAARCRLVDRRAAARVGRADRGPSGRSIATRPARRRRTSSFWRPWPSLAQNKAMQQLVAEAVDDVQLADASRMLALRAIARGRVSPTPDAWIDALLRAVEVRPLAAEAVAGLQSLGLARPQRERSRPVLLRFAAGETEPLGIATGGTGNAGRSGGRIAAGFVRSLAGEPGGAETPPLQRAAAAGVLAQANLDAEQKLKIAGGLNRLSPLELTRLLPIFDGAEEAGAAAGVAALAAHDNRVASAATCWWRLSTSFRVRCVAEGDALLAKVDAANGQRRERLEELFRIAAGRRCPAWACGLQQQEGGLHRLSCRGLCRRPDRARLDADRKDSDRARSARGDRLSERQLCPQFRAAAGGDDRRPAVQRTDPAAVAAGNRADHGPDWRVSGSRARDRGDSAGSNVADAGRAGQSCCCRKSWAI